MPVKEADRAAVVRSLVFPSIESIPKSELTSLSQARAFTLLLESSVLALFEPPGFERHIAALRRLVASASLWSLRLGKDALNRPEVGARLALEAFGL
jgi:hypothetical protein